MSVPLPTIDATLLSDLNSNNFQGATIEYEDTPSFNPLEAMVDAIATEAADYLNSIATSPAFRWEFITPAGDDASIPTNGGPLVSNYATQATDIDTWVANAGWTTEGRVTDFLNSVGDTISDELSRTKVSPAAIPLNYQTMQPATQVWTLVVPPATASTLKASIIQTVESHPGLSKGNSHSQHRDKLLDYCARLACNHWNSIAHITTSTGAGPPAPAVPPNSTALAPLQPA